MFNFIALFHPKNRLEMRLKDTLGLSVILLTAMALGSCSSDGKDSSGIIRLRTGEVVPYDNTAQWLQVEPADPQGVWNLSLSFPDGVEWCTLDKTAGTGPGLSYVSYTVNTAEASRSVRITARFEGGTESVVLTQEGRGGGGEFNGWLELPEIPDNEEMIFLTHFIPADPSAGIVEGDKRNFSLWYSTVYHIPYWVAYPVHRSYLGSVGRTNAWAYDPLIPQNLQVNLGTQYYGMGNGYNRGHMLPSASRQVTVGANEQTFYYTNMTPQEGVFNQNVWADLEDRVRKWGGSGKDTLYVVTGAVLQTAGGSEKIKLVTSRPENNDSKKLGVPNYYYKVLLKYNHNDGKPSYRAIGFWFENSNEDAKRDVNASDTRSVRWVEQKTGMDFFVNLAPDIQERVETTNNPAEWGL